MNSVAKDSMTGNSAAPDPQRSDLDLNRAAAVEANLRGRLALALDVDDLVSAMRLGRALHGHFRVAKVGLELYSAAGPDAIAAMADIGYDVFCDLKLHDIPNTVARAAQVLGELGVSYLTAHASGGTEMLRAAADGLAEGSNGAACLLAVTVLTSDPSASAGSGAASDLVSARLKLAAETGCGGIVCAASDLHAIRGTQQQLQRVVPGIRLPGDPHDDQRRVATPAEALGLGADLLVIGRTITRSGDPLAAADRLHEHRQSQPRPNPESALA